MKILHLAWRNVFRHRRRTVITSAAISVGLAAMIFMDTMMNGVDKMAAKNIIDVETGTIEIFAKGYYREEGMFPLDTIIERPEVSIGALKTIPEVKGIAPRLKFQCRINNGIDELPVLGIGIDPARDRQVFAIEKAITAGHYLKAKDDILIGTDLAGDLGVGVDSLLTVITKDRHGTYNAYDCIVAGLVTTGHPLVDRNAVLLNLELAQSLVAIDAGVTELCLKTKDDNKLMELKREISEKIGRGFEVYTWKELNANIFEISGMKRSVQFLLAIVVVIIAAIGIINTMLMAVMERIPEIGTMKALGFSNPSIVRMFIYEGGIIGLFGSLLGSVVGLLVSLQLAYFGLDLSSKFKNLDITFPMKFVIKGDINYLTVLAVFLFGVVISVLVTLGPVRKATKLQPAEALRHV